MRKDIWMCFLTSVEFMLHVPITVDHIANISGIRESSDNMKVLTTHICGSDEISDWVHQWNTVCYTSSSSSLSSSVSESSIRLMSILEQLSSSASQEHISVQTRPAQWQEQLEPLHAPRLHLHVINLIMADGAALSSITTGMYTPLSFFQPWDSREGSCGHATPSRHQTVAWYI